MNPARRPRSAVERLATPLIAVALCLSMAAEARAAYAGSDIWYNSANGKLSGIETSSGWGRRREAPTPPAWCQWVR